MATAETYLKRRRNILPVIYFPRRKHARSVHTSHRNPPTNDVPQVNEAENIPNVPENDAEMVQDEQNQLLEVNEIADVQIVPENNEERMAVVAQIPSRETELQYELVNTKETMAKREEELERCKRTIQNLQSLLGAVDLTEDDLDVYDGILMSNENNQNAGTNAVETINDSSDESADESANKENAQPMAPNQQSNTANHSRTDMMFSFQHEFVEEVNKLTHRFVIIEINT